MIDQINFYMTEASDQIMEDRREYLENVIVKRLIQGIEDQKKWSPEFASLPDSVELIEAYRAGLAFFTDKGFNNQKSIIQAPAIRYHGGKFRLAPWIIEHMPTHTCYVEPFGGAASVLLRKPRSYAEVYNDLDGDIVNLFRVLRDPLDNHRLRTLCALTPYSRDEFNAAYTRTENPIERARRMVVRACMGFGSAAGVGGQSGFRSDSKRKYATASHLWARYPDNLAAIGQRFEGVIIENKTATDVIRRHDEPTTLFFVDPPYMPETRVNGNRYYQFEMSDDDHLALLKELLSVQGMVLLSGYDSALYNDTLTGWRKEQRESRISAGRGTKVRTECLWISPNCKQEHAV